MSNEALTSVAEKRVVIVGAGPGGLAASILLATAGVQVTVLERLAHVGGRTSTFQREGFTFDVGPTFFLYPQVLREIFAAAGSDLDREVEMVRLDPQYRLVFGGGGELLATPDLERMRAAVDALSPGDGAAFLKYYEVNRRKLAAFAPILSSSFSGWKDLFRPEMFKSLPLLKPWRSLHSDLSTYFQDPRIRLAFSFQSKYLGMSPFRCPSLFSILAFMEYEYGVFHPVGGCGAITLAMAKLARSLGVEIKLEHEVEKIEFAGKRPTGAYAAGEFFPCDSMVINADFARAMLRLVPDGLRPRWSDRQIAKKQFSCSTFMMYLGVRGKFEDVAHHTIYIPKDYPATLTDIERDHVLSSDPPFYLQNASVTDRGLAPEGCSTLYALFPVTHQHGNVDWEARKDEFRALAKRQLRRVGVEVEGRVLFERDFTPDNWATDFQLHLGSTFSMTHSFRQMLHLRPRNRFEDLESVYLVGGGTHPGSGLPVIFESSRISSRLLLEDLGMGSRAVWKSSSLLPMLAEVA
jgi:phytoene desaturase